MEKNYVLEKNVEAGTYDLTLSSGEVFATNCYSIINALEYSRNLLLEFEKKGL